MKRSLVFLLAVFCLCASPALAHFGLVIPSRSMVMDSDQASLGIDLGFVHPMEGNGMDMARPKAVFVSNGEQKQDLLAGLREKSIFGKKAWMAEYKLTKPGSHIFALEPAPYFEPAEDSYIIHYTKVIVPAFGEEDGWDEPAGLKTEIIPLTRPFGNYAGNLFRGQVLLDGKSVANCEVEIEYYNKDGRYEAPNDHFVTQVVKTDANGIFAWSAPWAGWWGLAALNTAKDKLDYQGKAKKVELGAVLWLEFAAPLVKKPE